MKKFEHKTKDERRRVLLSKNNELSYTFDNEKLPEGSGFASTVLAKTRDVNRRVVALVLVLAFVLTTVVVGVNLMTKAEEDGGFNMLENSESGMVMRKGLKLNDNGTPDDTSDDYYELQLEAYATAPFTTKSYDSDTPLDVVLVMDQSSTMDTKDVLTGGYSPIENKTSFKVSEAEGKFYKVTDENGVEHYYKIFAERSPNKADYVVINDQGINSWTPQQARDKYLELNESTNLEEQMIYRYNDEDTYYEPVYVSKDYWYKHAGNNMAVSNFFNTQGIGADDWGTDYNNSKIGNYYYNSAGNIATQEPDWHKVHEITQGITLGGYYIYLWYYTKDEDDSTVTNESTFNNALNNNRVAFIPGYYTGSINRLLNNKKYHAWDNAWNTTRFNGWSLADDENYIGGLLYTREPSDIYNNMYVIKADGSEETLAWPLTGTSTANPGSTAYTGDFYTNGYKLYYLDEKNVKHEVAGCTSVYGKDEVTYNGTLYDWETITRLDAEKLGASNLAQQIAGAVSGDADHRIAVVGFNNDGSTRSGLVPANENDSDPDNDVNDTIDAAISSLSASGTSSVAAGLTKAGEVLQAAGALGGTADSRKRIVVLFTDDDTVENEAESAAEALKDTYHASIYTIGYNKDGVSSTVENWLDHLSSNYYGSTRTDDGIDYSATSTNKASILSVFSDIATAMGTRTPTTTATLGTTNAILRDVISKDFIAQNLTIEAYTVAADSVDSETGAPEWSNTQTPFTLDNNNHSVTPNANETTTVDVQGFDYSSNYVSAERTDGSYGKKLVVTISGLKLKDNVDTDSDRRIYSNTKDSGIYKKGAENLLIGTFPRPYVDKVSNLVPKGTSGIAKDGVVVNKYLTANENGNYDLTLEAYTTSKNETSTITEKIPTDFVVVVDQSASMQEADMPTGDATPRSDVNLETVATGNYFYYDEASGEYYKVYGVKDYLYRYYPANYWFTGDIVEHFGTKLRWFMGETDTTTNINNAFYFREEVNGKGYYQPISSTIVGKIGAYMMTFKYTSITGNEVEFNREVATYSSNGKSPWYKNVLNGNVINSGTLWTTANGAVQLVYPHDNEYSYSTLNLGLIKPRTGMYINYPMYERHVAYTKLCYRDVNGVEHVLQSNQNNGQSTWEYCDDNGVARSAKETNSTRPTYSNLYTFDTTQTRIAALKTALTEFAQAVADEEDYYGHVDNKVSIIGFSSDPETYSNTELLTGDTFQIQKGSRFPSTSNGYSEDGYNYNGKMKTAATDVDYRGALVSSTDGDNVGVVNENITQAISAITAYGGTQPEDGLDMAKSVLDNRRNKTHTLRSVADTTVNRNTVVIFFTDGQPGNYHYSDQYKEANDVVESAKRIKADGTSIFSIGVFGESDGNPLTYNETNLQDPYDDPAYWEYMGGYVETYPANGTYYCLRRQWRPGNSDYTETANDTIYDYMSVTSSNYPDAEDFIAPAWLNDTFNENYIAATDGDAVRKKSTAEGTNKYYRMASSQSTLIEAFLQAITMSTQPIESDGTLGPSTILRDILETDNFEMTSSTTYTVETAKGKADSNGVVTFENEKTAITLAPPPSLGSDEIEVTGFDYATNSIYYGKPADTDNDLNEHQGRKLIVTLTNVVPKQSITSDQNDDRIFSNEDDSGLWKNVQVAAFPKPAITRHSYTLNVDGDNKSAKFAVTTTLVAGDGATTDLSDVILVKPDGQRIPYTQVSDIEFTMTDGQSFYFENVPQGYSVKTSTKAPDSFYTYTFWENNNEAGADTLSVKDETSRTLNYSDNVLHVDSVSSYKTVTIAESVSGKYANESDVFSVKLTLTPPEGDTYDEDTIALASDVILNKTTSGGKYEATISGLPGNQNEKELRVPAGWTLQVEPIAHEKYDVDAEYPKYNTDQAPTQVDLPSSGVVIQNDLTNIFINNIAKDIPVEGILSSANHNWIIYILLAAGFIGAGVGGYFLWKKKDEFVE